MSQPLTMGQALWHGFRCRCPNCGIGKLFGKFLKVVPACRQCHEPYHHHRADDLPAYLLVLILGHILVPIVITVELVFTPPYWVYAAIWLPLTLILAIGLLQPVKGMVVAFQWKKGMHGFHRKPTNSQ